MFAASAWMALTLIGSAIAEVAARAASVATVMKVFMAGFLWGLARTASNNTTLGALLEIEREAIHSPSDVISCGRTVRGGARADHPSVQLASCEPHEPREPVRRGQARPVR